MKNDRRGSLKAFFTESESPLDLDQLRDGEIFPPKENLPGAELLRQHTSDIRLSEKRLEVEEDRGRNAITVIYRAAAAVLTVVMIGILMLTVSDMPSFGGKTNPTENEVQARYLEKGLEEGGATNLVANMILDYRAFDTLGESNVLFMAVCTVILLLRVNAGETDRKLQAENEDRHFEPKNDLILQTSARALVPVILLFGIYVILNGHLGPGGGFSGGAVMGAGLILYLNAFGFARTERFFSFRTFKTVSFAGLAFYAVSKAYSFFTGANGLHSFISNGTPGAILSAGLILPLNMAVGMVVCCTMYAFYTLFRKGDI